MAYRKKTAKGDSVWQARRTAGQCGVSAIDLSRGDKCLFLKIEGNDVDPTMQIVGKLKGGKVEQVSPTGKLFRSVPTGQHRCKRNICKEEYSFWQRFCNATLKNGKTCRAPTGPIFKWQEGRPTGEVDANGEAVLQWHDVVVWEKVVLADEAVKRGFHVPTMSDGKFRMTEAHEGERTEGHCHSVSKVAESPLMDVARAAIPDEELGIKTEGEQAELPPKADEEDKLTEEDMDFLKSL